MPVAIIGSAVFISIAMNLLKPPPLKAESPDTALVVKTQLLHAANATLAVESQGTVLPRTQTLLTSEVSAPGDYVCYSLWLYWGRDWSCAV